MKAIEELLRRADELIDDDDDIAAETLAYEVAAEVPWLLSELHTSDSKYSKLLERWKEASVPSVEGLRAWAEWFDDPKNPACVVFPSGGAGRGFTAGFVLRRIAGVLGESMEAVGEVGAEPCGACGASSLRSCAKDCGRRA